MPHQRIVSAIDVGTDKISTLIAVEAETGLRIVGFAAVPSKGVKKSQIIDLEKVLGSISESLDAAERMAGLEVKSAFVSVSGQHIHSQNSRGVVAVSSAEQEVTPDDVKRVIEAARAISLPSDREIIHVVPKDFKVDSQEGVKDPVGMTGVRLESEAHIITGYTTALRNMEKCVTDLGIAIDGFVFAGLAAAEVVLSETEKELGAAVVDIGAGTTSICAFVDGSLEYSSTLELGARHITQDIAVGLRMTLDEAEKLKQYLSTESLELAAPLPGESKADHLKRRRELDQLRLSDIGISADDTPVSRRLVQEIMLARMKEIMQMVGEKLESRRVLNRIPAGVILTGGGAKTVEMVEVAKRTLQLPARIGQPASIPGLLADIRDPVFATNVGLLVYGSRHQTAAPGGGFSISFDMFRKINVLHSTAKLARTLLKKILP